MASGGGSPARLPASGTLFGPRSTPGTVRYHVKYAAVFLVGNALLWGVVGAFGATGFASVVTLLAAVAWVWLLFVCVESLVDEKLAARDRAGDPEAEGPAPAEE